MDMDKQSYASQNAPGIAPPPSYDAPPYPQSGYPPNPHPPGAYAPSSYPPVTHQPGIYPPSAYPQDSCNTASPLPTNTVIITGGPTLPNFGPDSVRLTCPYCHHNISTKVESKATTKTHLIALVLCLCLCWVCCCCPYCMDSCQGRNHYCPQCHAFLGVYNN